eukprot:CAMPEP_0116833832 /NCGR_PEP_ID=MMETSP0418-20121206/6659_1 /TAXON_ID=1158023 /ORGANISM="Astrosyne radiata, Strain 13vi08-1A" /LENGTH=203 /DNA_ID=CAMNT_0004463333 /DNA_START=223 /DNA_END=834 /DNA_ORIENTATION=+
MRTAVENTFHAHFSNQSYNTHSSEDSSDDDSTPAVFSASLCSNGGSDDSDDRRELGNLQVPFAFVGEGTCRFCSNDDLDQRSLGVRENALPLRHRRVLRHGGHASDSRLPREQVQPTKVYGGQEPKQLVPDRRSLSSGSISNEMKEFFENKITDEIDMVLEGPDFENNPNSCLYNSAPTSSVELSFAGVTGGCTSSGGGDDSD